jgi:hypothetical protein
MENVEEDTEAKLNAYLDYYTYSYEEVPISKKWWKRTVLKF